MYGMGCVRMGCVRMGWWDGMCEDGMYGMGCVGWDV